MSWIFNRRTAHFGVFKNLFEEDDEKSPTGATIPVTFAVDESDLDRLVPTQEHAEGEAPFPSLTSFLFDADGRFLYPYLSPLQIYRKPDQVEITIWPDKMDGLKKLTIREASVHSVSYAPASGKRYLGDLSFAIKMSHLSDEEFLVIKQIQHSSCDMSCKTTQDDLFAPPATPPAEEQTDLDLSTKRKAAKQPKQPKRPKKTKPDPRVAPAADPT
jgi:hypothetical protein